MMLFHSAVLMAASDMNSVFKPWVVQSLITHLTIDFQDISKFKAGYFVENNVLLIL